jgi:hypothetical protein
LKGVQEEWRELKKRGMTVSKANLAENARGTRIAWKKFLIFSSTWSSAADDVKERNY